MSDIVYPFFLECCEYTDDSFWKFVFEDLAYERPPIGTYINKHFLCCNYRGKEFSYKIDKTKHPEVLYNDIHSLLFEKFGLLSDKDKANRRRLFDNKQDELKKINASCWKSIKKKSIRQKIIENFVIDMKKQHNLSIPQSKRLLSIIIIGLIFKTITSDDIEYTSGKIMSISGISFQQKRIILNKDIYNAEQNYTSLIINKPLLSDLWEKYKTQLHKMI